jgi:ABC-type lipoprotein release transport system permease subunit
LGLQKHANLFGYAIDSVFRFKTRTIAIILALLLALTILGSVVFISDGLTKEATMSTLFAPDITAQLLQAGRQIDVPTTYIANITEIAGVTKVIPRVWGYIYQQNKLYTYMGIDVQNMPIPKEIGLTITSGRFLEPNDTDYIVVGKSFADNFQIRANDNLTLINGSQQAYNYTVIGIFSMNVNLFTSDLILAPIQTARTFFSITPEYATDLCVYTSNSAQTPEIATQISTFFPEIRVITRAALNDELMTAYGARSGFISTIWYVLLLSVLMVALNQASAVSTESKREVGILKTLGFSTMDILEIRLGESIILGLTAASISIFTAALYDTLLGAPVIRDLMLGWASIYPTFQLPIMIQLSSVGVLYGVALFPLLVASLVPAWASAVTEPDIAMRGT